MNRPRLTEDIMVTRLVVMTPEQNVLEGIRQLLKNRITGAPVVDSAGRYLGMFSEKCCMSTFSTAARLASRAGNSERIGRVRARDVMQTKLVTLKPEMDVFEAIGYLLQNRISGAPVLDDEGNFLGVFSEKGSMDVLIESAYSQLPTTRIGFYMDIDRGRVVSDDTDLLTIARIFLETPYRRLEVVRDGKVVGQISRRDVLNCQVRLSDDLWKENASTVDLPANEQETLNLQRTQLRQKPPRICEYMDKHARTIPECLDMLSLAQIFRQTPYRRLPVLRDGYLVGQVSRRDLLTAAHRLMEVDAPRDQNVLYLSGLVDRSNAPAPALGK